MIERFAPCRQGLSAACFGAVLTALPAAAAPAGAVDLPAAIITVEGEASADVVPDTAIIALGVDAVRPTAAAATTDAASAAQSVLAALRADGVADTDVTTTAIALDPIYPDNVGNGASRAPRAFRAATNFRVTIKPAERAGPLASHLVDKGATSIDGIDYASSQEAKRLDELRAAAMRDALHKAQICTGALDLHLGRVVEITPLGGGFGAPAPMMQRSASLLAKATLPSNPGLLALHTSVTVRWALDP